MAMPNHDEMHDDDDPQAIHVLMSGLVDYAGLFPPAKLAMMPSVQNYAQYLRTPEAWMLGRFILPVSRLEEFRETSRGLLPKSPYVDEPDGGEPWPISAIIDGDLDENLDSIFAFNHEHENPKNGLAVVDAIELKVPTTGSGLTGAAWIDDAIELIPEEVFPFFEIPIFSVGGVAPDFRGMIASLAGADGAAKLRTGGITPEAFPPAAAVAEFLLACNAAEVPFKATAGLHHACRAHYPLTYEPDAAKGLMHGFLNVFLAAAFVHAGRADAAMATAILEETDPAAFQFGREVVRWRNTGLELMQLAQARETFALSYGSCSFEEPVQELQRMRVI